MARGVNVETTGGLLAREGPLGVQVPWSMARLTGEVRPEKPWKWEISSPLQLEPWPQAEVGYCITDQKGYFWYFTVSEIGLCGREEKHTNKLFLMCKALRFIQKTTKKVRQRARNAPRRADWPLPPRRCVRTCKGPWSSPQLRMNMSPHRPTGRTPPPPLSHLHHVKPTPVSTTNSYPTIP